MHTFLKLCKITFLLLFVTQLNAQRVYIVADTFNFSKKHDLKANKISYRQIKANKVFVAKLNEFPQSASLFKKSKNTVWQGYGLMLGSALTYLLLNKTIDRRTYYPNKKRDQLLASVPLFLGYGTSFAFLNRSNKLRKKAFRTYNFYKNNSIITK